jgi:protein O-mannosyl-transferase
MFAEKTTQLALATLALIIFVLYAQTLFFDLTYLDDNQLVQENFWFISSASNIPQVFSRDVFLETTATFYRPLLTLSFIPDAIIAGKPTNLVPFHLTNVALHVTASLLLFILLRKLMHSTELSFALSALFATHPALTQAVAWIPGRNDSLLAVWVIISLLSWMQFLTHRRWRWLLVHFFGFLCSVLTKETGVVLPILLILFTIMYQRKKLPFEIWWIASMGWLIVGLSWFVMRSQVVTSAFASESSYSLLSLWNNWPAMITYLGKAFFPTQQSVLTITQNTPLAVGFIVLVVLFIYFAVLKYQKKSTRRSLFTLIWFFLFLSPAVFFHNAVVLWGQDLQLEHRLYLPLIGIMLLYAELYKHFFSKFGEKKYGKKIQVVIFITIFLVFTIKSFTHSKNFVNQFSFWNSAVKTSPYSPLAHRNLGAMYQLSGDVASAKIEYYKTLALNPNEIMVNNNLGIFAQEDGNFQQAEELYRKEIKLNPNFSLTYLNLAQLLSDQNRMIEAREIWLKGSQLNPDNPTPLIGYANTFKELDPMKYAELITQLQNAGVSIE